jgi:hypothetical protein
MGGGEKRSPRRSPSRSSSSQQAIITRVSAAASASASASASAQNQKQNKEGRGLGEGGIRAGNRGGISPYQRPDSHPKSVSKSDNNQDNTPLSRLRARRNDNLSQTQARVEDGLSTPSSVLKVKPARRRPKSNSNQNQSLESELKSELQVKGSDSREEEREGPPSSSLLGMGRGFFSSLLGNLSPLNLLKSTVSVTGNGAMSLLSSFSPRADTSNNVKEPSPVIQHEQQEVPYSQSKPDLGSTSTSSQIQEEEKVQADDDVILISDDYDNNDEGDDKASAMSIDTPKSIPDSAYKLNSGKVTSHSSPSAMSISSSNSVTPKSSVQTPFKYNVFTQSKSSTITTPAIPELANTPIVFNFAKSSSTESSEPAHTTSTLFAKEQPFLNRKGKGFVVEKEKSPSASPSHVFTEISTFLDDKKDAVLTDQEARQLQLMIQRRVAGTFIIIFNSTESYTNQFRKGGSSKAFGLSMALQFNSETLLPPASSHPSKPLFEPVFKFTVRVYTHLEFNKPTNPPPISNSPVTALTQQIHHHHPTFHPQPTKPVPTPPAN